MRCSIQEPSFSWVEHHDRPFSHGPQSQSFFQRYRSNLPTSLIRLRLSTRGCEPRRPDAVSGTAGCWSTYSLRFHKPVRAHRILCIGIELYQRFILFSGQANSKEWCCQRAKITLFGTLPDDSSAIVLPRLQQSVKEYEPFSLSGQGTKSHSEGTSLSFRTDSPEDNCCSPGTLIHFGHQSSRLIICYYHQDLY